MKSFEQNPSVWNGYFSHFIHKWTKIRFSKMCWFIFVSDYEREETCKLLIFEKPQSETDSERLRQNFDHLFGFCFVSYYQDKVYNTIEYLIQSVYEPQSLNNFNLLNVETRNGRCEIEDLLKNFDIRISQAFKFISLPSDWTLLGPKSQTNEGNLNKIQYNCKKI